MAPKTVYPCYDDRRLLVLVFNKYKSDVCLAHTDVQGDFSEIGSAFISFLSTVAICRIVRKASQKGLLDKLSYAEPMDDLSSAWRKTNAPMEPVSDDGYGVYALPGVYETPEALDLSKAAPKPKPKKRGRKPKEQIEQKPKRPCGCSRKNTTPSVGTVSSDRLEKFL